MGFLDSILGKKETGAPDPAAAQALQLDLDEAHGLIETLKQDLERERGGKAERASEAARNRLAKFAENAATPIGQLLAQEHLLEAGKEVAAGDVLKAARGLVDACLAEGMEPIGAAGEEAAYDPARHMPLAGGLAEGAAVVVRLPGLSIEGSVLRKAGVEPA